MIKKSAKNIFHDVNLAKQSQNSQKQQKREIQNSKQKMQNVNFLNLQNKTIKDNSCIKILFKRMNKSFQMNSSTSHYLPKINKINESANLIKHKGSLYTDRYRANSTSQIRENVSLTKKLVNMDDIKNVEQYDKMNEKQLLRQHEKLLRVIKKFQQILDIHLSRKKRQLKSEHINTNKPSSTKEELIKCEIANNKKIIQNYQRQIKDLQSAKKLRKLNDIIQEKIKVNNEINQLKKDIFNLKNDDNMAGRNLVEDRPQIQRQIKQIQKDLKIQITKKYQYAKKVDQLTEQLNNLKKECEGININQITNQKTNNSNILIKISLKKAELQQVKRQREQIQHTIQDNMVSKAKRNKGLRKQIQNNEKKMAELNEKIQEYKDKINRYQKVMEILPNTADNAKKQISLSLKKQNTIAK